jgi:glutathione S-transferase
VWDSLAICEFVNEKFALAGLPHDLHVRAHCRSVVCEMHSGFMNLRRELPMNCRRTIPGFAVPECAQPDIARVLRIWTDCRTKHAHEGPWLFGTFSMADAFYAPVVLRFVTYDVPVSEACRAYMATVLADQHMQEWIAAARAESEIIPHEEK